MEPSFPTWRDALLRLPLVSVFVVLPIVVLLLVMTEPIGAFVISTDSITFLGALLGAQAAVAALTLAVMLFVMQGVSARRDVDDRFYAEYIIRSWVWPVFCGSIGAVAFTGAVLTVERVVGDAGDAAAYGVPGVPNLAVLAVVALVTSLTAPVVLFGRAIRLAKPEHWQTLRLDVNKREVGEAVGAFLGRVQRAESARVNKEPDFSILFPDAGERSADRAVRALLDDARRAMDERRHGELVRSLNSIKMLVSYAMDEIEGDGLDLAVLGTDHQWPPLYELGQTLYSYREEVISAGNRDYLQELLTLDYWFVSTGLRRSCLGLVAFGLSGYRWNYVLSARVGSRDRHEMLRDRFLMNLDGLTVRHEPEALASFMREVIRHQGEVLSDALHSGFVEDYLWLHSEFDSKLSDILERWDRGAWNRDVWSFGMESELLARLRQEYRIAIMGLTGRAVILSDSGDVADPAPYLDVARALFGKLTDLSDVVSGAMRIDYHVSFSQWWGWDTPYRLSAYSGSPSVERFPRTCFAVLLMERAEDLTLNLDLHGNAKPILEWFLDNAEGLERFVIDTSSVSASERREFATEALRRAVLHDEVQVDLDVISRELSVDRVGILKSGVDAGMLKASSVQRVFERAGSFVRLEVDAVPLPEERGARQWLPKAFFIDPVDHDQTYRDPIVGQDLGRHLSHGAVYLLCDELQGAPLLTAPLDTLDEIFAAINVAVADLNPQGDVAIVLAGDAEDVFFDPYAEDADGYEPFWRLAAGDSLIDVGRYRGYPILRGPTDGGRRVYVVDLDTWGSYERAPFDHGEELRVDVGTISPERAQELLDANPDWSEQLDDASKMRKIQTYVDVWLGVRHGFRVLDWERARRISPAHPLAGVDAESSGHCCLDDDEPTGK